MFTAVGATLAALAATGPAAFVIEDLHWADPSTLDLLTHVFVAGVECAVVGTWRLDDAATPEGHVEWFERISRLATVRHLELMPLSEDETAHQLSLLGVEPKGDLAARVHRRTQGQPLFTEQLASTLDDETRTAEDAGRPPRPAFRRALRHSVVVGQGARRRGPTADSRPARRSHRHHERQPRRGPARPATTSPGAHDQRRCRGAATPTARRGQSHDGSSPAKQARCTVRSPRCSVPRATRLPPRSQHTGQGAAEPEHEIAWRIAAARSAAAGYATAMEAEQWLRAFEIWPAALVSAGTPPVTRAEAYLAAMDALRFSLQFDRAAKMSAEAEPGWATSTSPPAPSCSGGPPTFRAAVEGTDVGLALIEESLAAYRILPVQHRHGACALTGSSHCFRHGPVRRGLRHRQGAPQRWPPRSATRELIETCSAGWPAHEGFDESIGTGHAHHGPG